jgi:hypothetical protein
MQFEQPDGHHRQIGQHVVFAKYCAQRAHHVRDIRVGLLRGIKSRDSISLLAAGMVRVGIRFTGFMAQQTYPARKLVQAGPAGACHRLEVSYCRALADQVRQTP